jgi:hypothetical protein
MLARPRRAKPTKRRRWLATCASMPHSDSEPVGAVRIAAPGRILLEQVMSPARSRDLGEVLRAGLRTSMRPPGSPGAWRSPRAQSMGSRRAATARSWTAERSRSTRTSAGALCSPRRLSRRKASGCSASGCDAGRRSRRRHEERPRASPATAPHPHVVSVAIHRRHRSPLRARDGESSGAWDSLSSGGRGPCGLE